MAVKKPKSSKKSSAKSSHGGTRAGSGRKPSAAKALRVQVSGVEGADPTPLDDLIRPHGPRLVANLVRLADGGYERVTRKLEPAGLVMAKRPMTVPALNKDGSPRLDLDGRPILDVATDDKGRPVYVEDLLYPDLPPDRLVEVSRTVEVADGDRAANQYLIDRVEGKPRQSVEMSGPGGGAIPLDLLAEIARAYPDPE